MLPLVSLVITTHNREQFLGDAIASVLQQTWSNFELLIWDDGSTDASVELAQTYAGQDARVRVVSAEHRGRVAALSAAIAQTQGTYLGWIDSDDFLHPDALARTVEVLESKQTVGMVYTDYLDINQQGQVLGYGHRCRIPYSQERLLVDFMTFHFRLFRRSLYDKVGGIDRSLDFVEDYDLCLRLSEVTSIDHLQEPLYYYRIHPGNASQTLNLEQILRARAVVLQALQRRGMADSHCLDLELSTGRFILRPISPAVRTFIRSRQEGKRPKGHGSYRFAATLTNLTGGLPPGPPLRGVLTPPHPPQGVACLGLQSLVDRSNLGVPKTFTPVINSFWTGVKRRSCSPAALVVLASLPLVATLNAAGVQAQAIAPANDGTNTVVTPVGNQFNITGGTQAGTNLFHSFEQFGLNQGQIANFLANPQLQNILGRVVGNVPSVIDGRIQITGGNPNLFLLNPAGIIFGSHASLNIPGSFMATTANSIGFGNGQFNATGANTYATLTGTPDRLIFTSPQPGAIVNAGTLSVAPGQSLALVGGTVVNTGSLSAPGGQVLVAAVPGSTLVRFNQPGNLLSLEFQPLANSEPNNLQSPSPDPPSLAQLLTGGNLTSATGLALNPDGTVRLISSNTTLPTTPGTAIVSGSLSANGQTGGSIAVVGSRVGLVGATVDASGTNGGGTVQIGGGYQGQGTLPNASQTFVSHDSTIRVDATEQGNGGRAIVWADQSTVFQGTITARGGTISGDGGLVEVSGKENLQYLGTVDTTAPNGNVGTLLLDPADIFIAAGGPVGGFTGQVLFADPGPTTIFQNQLQTLPAGTNVIIQATNSITFDPAIGTLTFAAFPTPGGTIEFSAGGAITMDPTNTLIAPARNVTFTGGSLALGTINTTAPIGATANGGNITLTATGNISAADLIGNGYNVFGPPTSGGTIQVTSTAGTISVSNIASTVAPGGSAPVSGGTVSLTTNSNGGDISFQSIDARGGFATAPGPANGGNVTIAATGRVTGTGQVPTALGNTIVASGVAGGGYGSVQITHDGGPANQPLIVGSDGASTGNGTNFAINTGSESISGGQGFDFASSPFTSAGGSIQITFTNTPPTINPVPVLPSTSVNTPVSFSAASLNLSPFDLNGDNPLFVRLAAIAPNAIFKINGAIVAPGAVIPPNATLEFTPPPGFQGFLANAITLTIDDVISTSAPHAIAINITSTPSTPENPENPNVPNPCVLTSCNTLNPPPVVAVVPPVELQPDTPEDRFTVAFEGYLGLPVTRTKSIDEQREIAEAIERDTGAKPAFIYVSFVPPSLKMSGSLYAVKGPDTEQSDTERSTDQLELLVVTAKGNVIRHRISEATREKVMSLAQEFRLEVSDSRKVRTTSYLQQAQQLYQWLIAPLKAELQARQINNLVFLMDTGLRSLPVAALHDGQKFLIEDYSIGLMPSLSLTDTRYRDIRDVKLLTLGISESTQGQPPLPSVLVEVSTLVQQIWSGTSFLNETATLETLKTARQNRPYGIIHLATHADFLPGKIDNSYIQLWDDRLRLDQIRQLGWNDPQVELLVLSACDTALGDREAELGFGGLAVQSGVKTALASLWSVNDIATAALITRFYKDLRTAPIKAEALRQAQLAMLRGQVYVENKQIRGVEPSGIPLPGDTTGLRDTQLSHPYYWSAFTMIGNPW